MKKPHIPPFGSLLCTAALSVMLAPSVTAGLVQTNLGLRNDGKTMVMFSYDGSGENTGTWTVPTGISSIEVLVVGGGGAGARGGAWDAPGGGAGGLYYSETWSVTPGAAVSVAVGGGAPTTTSDASGANGGNSIFGDIIAYGGQGGQKSTNQGGNQGGYTLDGGANIVAGFLGGTGSGATGGAGAGENGRNGGYSPAYGGAGVAVPITGSLGVITPAKAPITGVYGQMAGYAGGGSAGFDGKEMGATHGEAYGGGSGSEPESVAGTPGFSYTGGGGGGGRGANGGAGGSGVILIAYQDAAVVTYTVSFESNGGNPVSSQSVASGTTAVEPTDPTRTGFIFDGWYSDSGLTTTYNFATPVTADITLYAGWITAYTVTFESNGGSAVSSQSVATGATASQPTAPTRTGYTFNGWFSDVGLNTSYDFQTPVTADLTLYAGWNINSYTLTYTAGVNGTISGTSPQTVTFGSSGTAVTAVPDSGYMFLKWSDNSTSNPRTDTNVSGNITVTAEFIVEPTIVTVPAGLNTGDKYRLVFVTSSKTAATETTAEYYNNFVNNVAQSVPQLAALGVTWKCLGNLNGVDPQVNTGTVPPPVGEPDIIGTYRLDGSNFATSYADLWDAPAVPVSFTQQGVAIVGRVWTGMGEAGSIPNWSAGSYIGNGGSGGSTGAGSSDSAWYCYGFNPLNNSTLNHLYAISDVITVGGAPVDPFDEWATSKGVTGGKEGDDDGDGVSNFQEFAFGLDPKSGASSNPITAPLNKQTGMFSYSRLANSGLTYAVLASTDLITWSPVTAYQNAGPVVSGVEIVEVELDQLPTESKFFLRVQANPAP